MQNAPGGTPPGPAIRCPHSPHLGMLGASALSILRELSKTDDDDDERWRALLHSLLVQACASQFAPQPALNELAVNSLALRPLRKSWCHINLGLTAVFN